MSHPGNRYFRNVIADYKSQYALMQRTDDKEAVAMQVLKAIRSQKEAGRFLAQNEDGSYFELDRSAALAKIKQALREDTKKKTKSNVKRMSKSSKTSGAEAKSHGNSKRKLGKTYDKDDFDRVVELLKNGEPL